MTKQCFIKAFKKKIEKACLKKRLNACEILDKAQIVRKLLLSKDLLNICLKSYQRFLYDQYFSKK